MQAPTEDSHWIRASLHSQALGVLVLLAAATWLIAPAEQRDTSSARVELERIRQEVRAAHARGDAAAYLAGSRKLADFLNGSPNSVLQLVSAQAFSGDTEGALQSLGVFVRMGQSNRPAFDAKQFETLRSSPAFLALQTEMARNDGVIAVGSKVFPLPEAGLVPEDIDYDPKTRRFYITSVMNHCVLVFEPDGRSRVLVRAPEPWPMMALKVDARRRTLWVTEVALREFKSIPEADRGKSVLLIYELDSGKLLHRIDGPPGTTLGDMTLTPKGDAIVADNEGRLYRVPRTTLQFERIDRGDFISPQTPAITSDQRRIFVPDYLRGIGILDLETSQVAWLPTDELHALSGIDGLYLDGNSLIATQNGTSPERVVLFTLDKSLRHVQSESILERATPTLGDPTHGVIVNGVFYYIANSGWDRLEDDGSPKSGTTPSVPLLMRVDLSATHH